VIKGAILLTKLFHPHPPYHLFSAPMYNQRQGIDWLVIEQEDHLIRYQSIYNNFCEIVIVTFTRLLGLYPASS
jgi:hypothetical protein